MGACEMAPIVLNETVEQQSRVDFKLRGQLWLQIDRALWSGGWQMSTWCLLGGRPLAVQRRQEVVKWKYEEWF